MSLIPPGSIETFIDLDGGRVRVLRSTSRPVAPSRAGSAVSDAPAAEPRRCATRPAPVLLIHGGGTDNSAISWYEVFAALGAAGTSREVIAIDLPGFGRTTGIEPVGGAPELAGFVARAAHALAIPRAVVMGVSMGGDVALNLALRHPELVAALVLIAPGGLVPVFRNRAAQFSAWLAAQLPDALLVPLTRLANRHVETVIKAVVKDPDALPPQVLDEFTREARRPGAGMAYGRYNQASLGPWSMRNNLLPAVGRVGVPALFFHGQDDPLVDPEGSRLASELMPDARLVLVPECGHWAQLEASDRFLTEVRDFLAYIDRRQCRPPASTP
ncbi:alpha/beta fold hydrolase [Sediminivirga luteola]|uniref:alpha/beta fold hydrolase n=1 Tax=Sediminivirga luteola TaxID=1774748 RepID=UPI001F587BC9|nr:alpha/beta fold hydrolase [Sediminivirga luteola]MCI2264576.1 alpha/beta fold hydrolase [Sediminivirga luteola]